MVMHRWCSGTANATWQQQGCACELGMCHSLVCMAVASAIEAFLADRDHGLGQGLHKRRHLCDPALQHALHQHQTIACVSDSATEMY